MKKRRRTSKPLSAVLKLKKVVRMVVDHNSTAMPTYRPNVIYKPVSLPRISILEAQS